MGKFFLTAVIAFTGIILLADINPVVMVDIDGVNPDMIKLEKEESSSLKVYHPGWQKGDKKACYLSANSKSLTKNWQEFSFSFVPAKSGMVKIVLLGKIYKLASGKRAKIHTIYDDLKVSGADLKNPDFEKLNDHSNFISWTSRWGGIVPYDTDRGRSAKVYAGNGLVQEFKVTQGKKVTISFKAKGLESYKEEDVKKKLDEEQAAKNKNKEGMWPTLWCPSYETIDLGSIDVSPSKIKDISQELQKRLDNGEKKILLSDGTYRITKLTVPANVKIEGSNKTVILLDKQDDPKKPVIELKGNNIVFENLHFKLHNSLLLQALTGKRLSVIKGENVNDILLSKIKYINSGDQYRLMRASVSSKAPKNKRLRVKLHRWDLFEFNNCKDIEVKNCYFKNFSSGVKTTQCFRVSFHDNIGINGLHNMMRFYNGSEYFKFYNNWFSHVKHPMVWDGGDCAPQHKYLRPSGVDAASSVYRNMKLGDKSYAQHMTGTYEVLCYGNYAEYGKTMAWGRKGRRVIVSGNSSRYMYDMAYDAEGCEEVIFANNIAVNSKAAGIGCFYYNDATVISGNMVVIEDIGHDIYKGQFVRMHSNKGVSSGKTIISGNLFVNHLKEPRFVKLDYCKNLTVSGNKFVNGGIKTNPYGGGNATVTGNTFISELPENPTLVIISRILNEFTFRNNTMINRNPKKLTIDSPAIQVDFDATKKLISEKPGVLSNQRYRQFDGNTIRGWKTPIEFTVPSGRTSGKVIFCNNLYEGLPIISNEIKNIINKNNTLLK